MTLEKAWIRMDRAELILIPRVRDTVVFAKIITSCPKGKNEKRREEEEEKEKESNKRQGKKRGEKK